METAVLVTVAIIVLLFIITILKSVKVISQAQTAIVERLGRYHKTLQPGLNIVIPYIDTISYRHDMREQVVTFEPQPVITQDNLVVQIDSVLYFQVTDPKAASYEISNYIWGIEQLTVTTLRNVIGGVYLETTLTSRDSINSALRGALDEATSSWGIRIARVELKSIDPPASVQEAMEKQMRAEREKRAAILNAEGAKQSAVLTAEGAKQSAVLNAEGQAQAVVLEAESKAKAAILEAEGQASALSTVFSAVKTSDLDENMLAYQYMNKLPEITNGQSNTVVLLPSELSKVIEKFTT